MIGPLNIWRDAFIDHLYVDPERQRSGIGTELLERAVAEMDGPEVRLWTFQANYQAVAFYRRNGFRTLEATDGSGNEERLPDYLLVRPCGVWTGPGRDVSRPPRGKIAQ
jgi:ribosomal protein S18 acetylase RimI-like enzyme